MLGSGVIKPNAVRVVEGETLLERVVRSSDASLIMREADNLVLQEESLRLLREGAVSGEKLVFKVNA